MHHDNCFDELNITPQVHVLTNTPTHSFVETVSVIKYKEELVLFYNDYGFFIDFI